MLCIKDTPEFVNHELLRSY